MAPTKDIDILENSLRKQGDLLDILLLDRTSKKNIIWATDSYEKFDKGFAPKDRINEELITGAYSHLIQPRASKSVEEQKRRTKDKAEVFTPLKIVDQINKLVDRSSDIKVADDKSWQKYITELMIEISCGEAPFIVSRYDPTSYMGKLIKLEDRVGFLDRKLHIISQHCDTPKEWLKWAKEAYKASYGYEWQGDNLLIARENLLYTLIDYYKEKFGRRPQLSKLREFAEIISWNIFQMDGLKYVIPMSCRPEARIIPGELTFLGETQDTVEESECEGCKNNHHKKHNGDYVVIMDWETNKVTKFVTLLKYQL